MGEVRALFADREELRLIPHTTPPPYIAAGTVDAIRQLLHGQLLHGVAPTGPDCLDD